MSELIDSEKEGIEKGMDAKWKIVGTPYYGNDRTYPAIVFNGVQYGDELPERLKEEGVEVVNSREEVEEDE